MSELEQIGGAQVFRSPSYRQALAADEARETSRTGGIERLFREIDTYLEFVAIARGA
jgi:hypothetical protein